MRCGSYTYCTRANYTVSRRVGRGESLLLGCSLYTLCSMLVVLVDFMPSHGGVCSLPPLDDCYRPRRHPHHRLPRTDKVVYTYLRAPDACAQWRRGGRRKCGLSAQSRDFWLLSWGIPVCFHLGTLPPWIRQQLSDVVDMGNWCGCSITSLYVEAPCIIESQLSDMQRGI